jgi:hypothetical protein
MAVAGKEVVYGCVFATRSVAKTQPYTPKLIVKGLSNKYNYFSQRGIM